MLDEYQWIRQRIAGHPHEPELWLPGYHLAKYYNCLFAFSLLSEDLKKQFLERYSEECKAAFAAHEMDEDYFLPDEWSNLQLIASDWPAFLHAYSKAEQERNRLEALNAVQLFVHYLKSEGFFSTMRRVIRRVFRS
jgi:hypothetical protein